MILSIVDSGVQKNLTKRAQLWRCYTFPFEWCFFVSVQEGCSSSKVACYACHRWVTRYAKTVVVKPAQQKVSRLMVLGHYSGLKIYDIVSCRHLIYSRGDIRTYCQHLIQPFGHFFDVSKVS